MAFRELQSKLEPLASPGPGPVGPLLLNAALIESDLLDAVLQIGAIPIAEPRVAVGAGRIVVSGKASFLGVAEPMQVEAVFEDDDGQVRFCLTASLPDTWRFGQSLPTLPQNFNFDPSPGRYGYGDSYLGALKFSLPVFVLTTHPCSDPEFQVKFERGLNFRGQMELDPSGPLKGLDLLTRSKNAPVISGLVASGRAAPEFFLSARIPLHGGDNPLLKVLQNVRLKLWCSLAAESTAAARIEVSVELELLKGRTVELYCPIRIGAPLNFLVIGSRFTGFALPDLGDIADLVGGKDLKDKIPEAVQSLGGLTIEEVRIGVSLTGPEVAWVLVSVHTTSPWKIIPGIFEIDTLFVTWLIESPFKSDQRRISCELEGRLDIAGVAADIHAHFPDFRVSGALSEGSTIELGKLLRHFIPAIPLPEDSLIISTLALLIDPKSETCQIDAQVDNVWSIPLGTGQLAIQSLSMSLARTPEGTSGSLTGVMVLPLPKAESEAGRELTLNLSAELPGASAKGWQFRGSTGDGQEVPIGVLIKMLASMLDKVTLPAPLEKFVIRNLSVSFNTGSKQFTFTCEGRLPLIDGKPVEAKVEIRIDQQLGKKSFHGQLIFPTESRPLNFMMKFEEDLSLRTFVATFHEDGGRQFNIDTLLSELSTRPITTGVRVTVKDALIACRNNAEGTGFIFGVNIGAEINLTDLPVVGKALPPDLTIGFESLRVVVASVPFTRESIAALNRLLPAGVKQLPDGAQSEEGLKQGFSVAAALMFGKEPRTLTLPVPERRAEVVGDTGTALPAAAKADDTTKWFDIDKSLGPLLVRRIGLSYESPQVGLKFDASLQLSVLTFSLEGLGLRYALSKSNDPSEILKNLHFTLDGAGLALGNGPIEIAGSLVRVPGPDLQLDGALLIRTAPFTFSAFGSYADLNGTISVMAFAVLLMELGDPTGSGAFVVTGLAFGFGVNRTLRLPPIEQVEKFPLVQAAMGSPALAQSQQLQERLREHVFPSAGNFWVAAGIKFNSFGLVDSFLLLSVSWGAEIEIGLLGLSRMTVPPLVQADQSIAGAELALRGVIRIAEGLIRFEARLTENSFIFSRACRLSGGFAFCVWFAGPHAGDFVISLGGYHPAFLRPAHYPLVPRLGMQLQIGDELSITGEAYFALTPSCLMAGGRLCAVFKSGGIEAWFIAYADFLMNWQPFYYRAEMGVTLGIALRLGAIVLRLELSVGLRLQGPPFGGEAHVSLWIISFTIPFGAAAPPPPLLTASDFVRKCLPTPSDVISVRIASGLLREQKVDETHTHRIVNSHQLVLSAQSVIPCTSFDGLAKGLAAEAPCGIRPMGKMSIQSAFSITAEGIELDKHVKATAITSSLPYAVWGKCDEEGIVPLPKTPDTKTVAATVGVRLASIPQDPVHDLPAIPISTLGVERFTKKVDWGVPEILSDYTLPGAGTTLFSTVWSDSVIQERNGILACLRTQLPPDCVLNEPALERLAKDSDYFQAEPEMCAVGY